MDAQARIGQDLIRFPDVTVDHDGAVVVGQQRPGMHQNHRVDVHVDAPGLGIDPSDDLVHVRVRR